MKRTLGRKGWNPGDAQIALPEFNEGKPSTIVVKAGEEGPAGFKFRANLPGLPASPDPEGTITFPNTETARAYLKESREAFGKPEEEKRIRDKYRALLDLDEKTMPPDVAAELTKDTIQTFLRETKYDQESDREIEAKREITEILKGQDPKVAREAINQVAAKFGYEFNQKTGELKKLKKEFIGTIQPFLEFCKTVRGYEEPDNAIEPGMWLMAMGRLFIGFEDVEMSEMARLLEVIEASFKDNIAEIQEKAPNANTCYGYLNALFSDDEQSVEGYPVYFARKWARAGFPVVELGHKVAAALMFTQSVGDIEPPWPAFYIKVPDHLITLENSVLKRILVMRPLTDAKMWWLCLDWDHSPKGRISLIKMNLNDEAGTIRKMLESSNDQKYFELGEMVRTIQMVAHLVGGACMMISSKEEIQQRPYTPKPPSNRNRPPGVEPPEGTRFIIAKNVQLDLREQVQQFITKKAKKGSQLTVQFVVRGHQRWQVCGKGRLDRKLIWIQAYWKGPQEATALLRGYELNRNPNDPKEAPHPPKEGQATSTKPQSEWETQDPFPGPPEPEEGPSPVPDPGPSGD